MTASKSSLGGFFSSRWFMGLAFFVLVLLLIAFTRAYYQNFQIQEEIKRLQSESQKLEARRIETLDLLNYVKSPAYVEEKARTELNMVKEGEHMAIITNQSGGNRNGQVRNTMLQSDNISNPLKWWNYFFH